MSKNWFILSFIALFLERNNRQERDDKIFFQFEEIVVKNWISWKIFFYLIKKSVEFWLFADEKSNLEELDEKILNYIEKISLKNVQ